MATTLTEKNRAALENLLRMEVSGTIGPKSQVYLDDKRQNFPDIFVELADPSRNIRGLGAISPQTKAQDIGRRTLTTGRKIGKTLARSAFPLAGAIGGSFIAPPPAGTILGAGVGEALRQTLSEDPDMQRLLGPILGDAPETFTESLTSVGEEMASMAIAETGIGAARFAKRTLMDPVTKRIGEQFTVGGGRIAKELKRMGIDPTSRAGVEAARKLGVELDIAQETQNPFLGSFISILKRAIGTQGITRGKQLVQVGQLRKATEVLLNTIEKEVPRRQAGLVLRQGMRALNKKVSRDFGIVEDALPKKVVLDFSPEQTSRLLDLAGRVRDIGNVTDAATIERLIKEGTSGELITFVKELGRFAFSGQATPEKAILKQANFTLREGLADSLGAFAKRTPEFGPVVKAYRAQVKSFSKFKDEFDQTAIQSMVKTETPEGLVSIFLAPKTGISASRSFKELLKLHPRGAQLEKRAQRAVLEEVFVKASAEKGVLLGNALETVIDRTVRQDTLKAILTPKQFEGLQLIRNTADILSLPKALTKPTSAQDPTLLGLGQAAGAGVAAKEGKLFLALTALLAPPVTARILIAPDGAKLLSRYMALKKASVDAAKLSVRSLAIKEEPAQRIRRAIPRDRLIVQPR